MSAIIHLSFTERLHRFDFTKLKFPSIKHWTISVCFCKWSSSTVSIMETELWDCQDLWATCFAAKNAIHVFPFHFNITVCRIRCSPSCQTDPELSCNEKWAKISVSKDVFTPSGLVGSVCLGTTITTFATFSVGVVLSHCVKLTKSFEKPAHLLACVLPQQFFVQCSKNCWSKQHEDTQRNFLLHKKETRMD